MGLRWNSTLVALLSFALGVLTLTQLCLSTQAEDAHVFFHAKVAYALTAVFVAMCFLLGYYQRVTMAQATALMGLIAFAFTVATVTHVAREWKYCRNISHASKVALVGCTSGQRDGGQSTSTTDQMCAIAGQVSAGRCIIAFAGDMDEMNTLDDISQATIGLGVTSMLLIAAIVATIVTQFWAHGSAKIRLQDSLFWYQVQKTPEWPGHREAMELFAELNPDSRAKKQQRQRRGMSSHMRPGVTPPQQPSLGVLWVLRACSPWIQLLSNVVVGLMSLAISPSNTVNYDVSAKTLSILLFVLLVVMVCLYVVCEDRRITEFLKNDLIVRIVVVIYAVLVYRSNTAVLKLDFLHLLIIFTHLIFIPVEFGRIRHSDNTKLRK